MISYNLRIAAQDRLSSIVRIGVITQTGLLLFLTLVATAHSQIFDQVIRTAVRPLGCDPRIAATGALLLRICGAAGNAGASTGLTTSLSQETAPLEDRRVQRAVGPLNVYFSGEYERFDKNVTKYEPGYKTDSGRALVGADYPFNDYFVAGIAFKYNRDNGTFISRKQQVVGLPGLNVASLPSSGFHTNSYGAVLHANFTPAPQSFVDVTAGYTRNYYSIARAVFVTGDRGAIGTAEGGTSGNEFKGGVNGGYNFSYQNITIGPRLGLNYRHTQINGYREKGRVTFAAARPDLGTGLELAYSPQYENSLTSVLGAHGSIAISTGFGVLTPQANLEYVHEFQDPQRKIRFSFVDDRNATKFRFENDPPDRNYFNLGVGIAATLPHGFSPFVNYRALVGYKQQSSHIVTAGLRVEF